MVSVVLAVHNGARSLEAAIASVLTQTLQDFELILVDDGSVDATPTVIARYAAHDRRLVSITNARRLGLAASLNIGWRRARGNLIARLDADDLCLPPRLERQVRYLAAHPEVDVLGTGAILVDEAGREIGTSIRPADHDVLVRAIYRANPFMHPTVMMRRTFLEALGGYDGRVRRGQDIDLWLRGCRRFRYANLDEPLIRYRVRRRPDLANVAWGTFVLARSAWREGRLMSEGPYAARYFAATLAGRLGFRDTRPR